MNRRPLVWSDDLVRQIRTMKQAGESWAEMGRQTGRSASTIREFYTRTFGGVERQKAPVEPPLEREFVPSIPSVTRMVATATGYVPVSVAHVRWLDEVKG